MNAPTRSPTTSTTTIVPRRTRAAYRGIVLRGKDFLHVWRPRSERGRKDSMGYESVRFPYDGTIDADGHVLEPPTLWETYLEERYRDRALRIRVDDAGFEYLEIGGKPSERSRGGSLGLLGAMGDPTAKPSPERRYATSMPFGAGDAGERIELLAHENLDRSVL